MSFKEFFHSLVMENTDVPKLSVDNPGGGWLKHEISNSIGGGLGSWGEPRRFGSTTAVFRGAVRLPLKLLKTFPGLNGEHTFTRSNSYEWLHKQMSSLGHTPNNDAPFLNVAHDGSVWVNEGNHRIKVAHDLGWESMPVNISYYSGGEQVAEGILYPEKVKAMHIQYSQSA